MLESLSKGSKINRGSKKGDGNYYGNSFVQLARKVWDLGWIAIAVLVAASIPTLAIYGWVSF